jgi:hypothetical protein
MTLNEQTRTPRHLSYKMLSEKIRELKRGKRGEYTGKEDKA